MSAQDQVSETVANESRPVDDFLSSNAIRLSMTQWAIAAVLIVAAVVGLPKVWSQVEVFDPGADYRIPSNNKDDYWLYHKLVEHALAQSHIILIGDSVIWGEYVLEEGTLTHYLNEQQEAIHFTNGGLSGSHPLALEGLVSDYTGGLNGKSVVLHCNLLWMSSPERDLSVAKDPNGDKIDFNHPRLIPQFIPNIPAYHAPTNERLGVIFGRNVALRSCVKHLNITDFDRLTPYAWSLEHPYENPFTQISLSTPPPDQVLQHTAISWTERGIPPQDYPWVPLEDSLQWQAFRRTVELLQGRGNRVFVILGPFNEHLLTNASRQTYQQLKASAEAWLGENNVPYLAPPLLPSEEYADSSHPLSTGYRRMAEAMLADENFAAWLVAGE